jgi:hypothetical protein
MWKAGPAIMHGGGQGATLLCGMRMGDHEAKAAQDQTFAARVLWLANSCTFRRLLMISFIAR